MDIEFKKYYANGTTIASNGITHIVDENKKRVVFDFSVTETYIFDETSPNIEGLLLDYVLRDLDRLKDELEKLKNNRGTKSHSEEPEL